MNTKVSHFRLYYLHPTLMASNVKIPPKEEEGSKHLPSVDEAEESVGKIILSQVFREEDKLPRYLHERFRTSSMPQIVCHLHRAPEGGKHHWWHRLQLRAQALAMDTNSPTAGYIHQNN